MRSQKTMQKGETWNLIEPVGSGAATSLRHRTLHVLLRARPHAPVRGTAPPQRGEGSVPRGQTVPHAPGWAAPAAYVPGISVTAQLKHVRFKAFLTAGDMKTPG